MTESVQEKEAVHDFWNRNINQFNQLHRDDVGSPEFYEAAEKLRYKYHYHLPPLFDRIARDFPGGKLLEVGCSMANDTIQFARRGLQTTGVDLTENAIELARSRFQMEGLTGEFLVADAENLPFDDNTFDVGYSFGVLHHTPDTPGSIAELRRVLRPGGKAFVMLYHRRSLNSVAHRLTGVPFDGSKDDPCPVEKTYTVAEVREMFAPYSDVHVEIDYLCGTGWGIVGRSIPQPLHRWLGRRVGWHLMIEATK